MGSQTTKRYAVFSIKKMEHGVGVIWTRAGNGYLNKDGSLNLVLDVLPIDGRLHIREAAERKDATVGNDPRVQAQELASEAAGAMGVAS